MNHSELIARPCPFCGKAADLKNDDTLYPSGIWWRECDGLRSYHGHKDRCEDDFQCWGMHCQETAGGCGASVSGDSATDALEKWNKRPDALQAMERVPMTEEVALKIAHRRATTYTHRSDPHYSGYAFVPYTLMDFVHDLETHHNITPPESI
mgnify:CR=1 FL=1